MCAINSVRKSFLWYQVVLDEFYCLKFKFINVFKRADFLTCTLVTKKIPNYHRSSKGQFQLSLYKMLRCLDFLYCININLKMCLGVPCKSSVRPTLYKEQYENHAIREFSTRSNIRATLHTGVLQGTVLDPRCIKVSSKERYSNNYVALRCANYTHV